MEISIKELEALHATALRSYQAAEAAWQNALNAVTNTKLASDAAGLQTQALYELIQQARAKEAGKHDLD